MSSILSPATPWHFILAKGKSVKDNVIQDIIRGSSYSIYMVSVFDKLKKIEFAGNNESKTIAGDIRTVLTSNFHDFKNPQQIKSSVVQIQKSLNTDNTNNTDNLPHIIRGGWERHAVYCGSKR